MGPSAARTRSETAGIFRPAEQYKKLKFQAGCRFSMSLNSGRGQSTPGPTLTVPDVSAADDGSGGIVLGLAGKQLAAAALVVCASLAVVVGAGAGVAFFVLPDDDADRSGEPDLDLVPSGADTVTYTNVDRARDDRALRQVADTWFGLENGTPNGTEAALADVENESAVDPQALHHVTAFSRYEEETGEGATEYSATILRTNWSEGDVVAAVEEDGTVSLEERSYNGATVYAPAEEPRFGPETWVAVVDEGTYVVGTKNATQDVVDVDGGEMEAFDGELRSAFSDTRSGYVRFASRVPEEQVPEGTDSINTSSYRNVTVLSGAYYTTEGALGFEMTMRTATEGDARDIHDVTDGAVSLLAGLSEVEKLQDELREVEVDRDGTDVVVTYESPVDQVEELLKAMDEAGDQTEEDTVERNVQAGASVDSEAGADEVTVTWTSNQNADFLRVEFSSLDGPDDTVRLSGVGDAYRYEGQDGTTVTVTVTAVAGDQETIIISRQVEL